MSDQPQQPERSRGISLSTLGIVILIGVILVAGSVLLERQGFFRFGKSRDSTAPYEGGDTARRSPLDVLRSEQVVVDETAAVSAGGRAIYRVTLPSDRPVRVIVEGVQSTANGFSVYCVGVEEVKKMTSGERFSYYPALTSQKVQKFDHTSRLPAGEHAVVVSNSENWFFTMQVRIRIVVDPK